MDGVTTALTDGFYRADGVANKFESGVYHLDYKSMNDDQFRFRVNISGVYLIYQLQSNLINLKKVFLF